MNQNDVNFPQSIEGEAKFQIGNAFYRAEARVARDLGVLAAAIYQQDHGQLRVLEAMAGCGVRSLRYWLESRANWVWTNEGNPELSSILQQNLAEAIASGKAQITHLDANEAFFKSYFQRDYYDLVDVDCFGSPAPYLSTSLWATKIGGLLYLTSTDGKTLTGHLPDNSLSVYGAYLRSHPAMQEQGLRVLIGSMQQQAATKNLGVEPIFSLYAGQTYRVMFRLVGHQKLSGKNYGFLGYCQDCGEYQTLSWRKLNQGTCPQDGNPLIITGPMWLGALHDIQQLQRMQQQAQVWHWSQRVALLDLMATEVNFPPYYYTLAEIGRRGKLDIPKRSHLIERLQTQGYQAAATHLNPQAVKTNASLLACIQTARCC